MKSSEELKLRKAKKRVEGIKDFYKHFFVYCMLSLALFIGRDYIIQFFQNQSIDKNFTKWLDWNFLIVLVFWGIGLLFQASKAFRYKLKFIEKWEERQLEKFMKEQEKRH